MGTSRPGWLELLYVAIGLAALVATGAQLPAYLPLGLVEGNLRFWQDTVATPASTFILVDIFFFGAAILIWMFGECRRLGIGAGWAWGYFLASAFIGISIAMPLFMAHRQRRIRLQQPDQQGLPEGADFVGIAIVLASAVAAAAYSLGHIPG